MQTGSHQSLCITFSIKFLLKALLDKQLFLMNNNRDRLVHGFLRSGIMKTLHKLNEVINMIENGEVLFLSGDGPAK